MLGDESNALAIRSVLGVESSAWIGMENLRSKSDA